MLGVLVCARKVNTAIVVDKDHFITWNHNRGWEVTVSVWTVFSSCEVAAVMLCAHTEQSINYLDPRLKIAPRPWAMPLHRVHNLSSSSSLLEAVVHCAATEAGWQPASSYGSEASHLWAQILLTHHSLGWQLQDAAVGHAHTHTLMHTVSVYILLHARIYVVYEEPQIKALLVLIDRTQSKQIL